MTSARPTWRRTARPKPRRWDARARKRELSARAEASRRFQAASAGVAWWAA